VDPRPRFALYPDRRGHWGTFVDLLETWSTTLTTPSASGLRRGGRTEFSLSDGERSFGRSAARSSGALAEVRDKGGPFKVLNPRFASPPPRSMSRDSPPHWASKLAKSWNWLVTRRKK